MVENLERPENISKRCFVGSLESTDSKQMGLAYPLLSATSRTHPRFDLLVSY